MTCIVGYKDTINECVYIGADSLGSNLRFKSIRTDTKVFHFKDYNNIVIGFTTSYRMGQLLMYSDNLFSEIDLLKKEEINHKYMVTKFVPELIKLYKENGYEKKYKDGELKGGTFLIGVNNNLWAVYDDFQVEEVHDLYNSCGSGADFAFGALYATKKNLNLCVTDKILIALESAENFSTGVQRPFKILNTKNDKVKIIR